MSNQVLRTPRRPRQRSSCDLCGLPGHYGNYDYDDPRSLLAFPRRAPQAPHVVCRACVRLQVTGFAYALSEAKRAAAE